MRQWFWRSAFDERYRGASEHFISKDLESVRTFIASGEGTLDDFGSTPKKDLWQSLVFRSNNSRSRAFVLALAACNPRNVTNGVAIDVADALSIYNQKQFHHIFPRAYLKRNAVPGNHNAMANICMLAASENSEIRDDDPGIYLPKCAKALGKQARVVFAANLLPDPREFSYSAATFKDFSARRAQLISTVIEALCEGKSNW